MPDLVNIPNLKFKIVHVGSFQLGSATRIKVPPVKDSILHSTYLRARVKSNFFLALQFEHLWYKPAGTYRKHVLKLPTCMYIYLRL